MRLLITILTFLTLIGCNDNGEKSVSQNDRLELVSEPDKGLREKYEQQKKDSLKSDTVFEEYLGDRLNPIRANFKRINEITEWTSVDKRKLNLSTEGGAATYYFLQDTLLKVVAIHFGETGKNIQEFYTKNGQLSFVFEQHYQYNRPITWDSTAMKENNDTETFDINESEIIEDRSYFENGFLIRQINNQDCGSPFAEDYLKEEQVRLKREFEKLKERLKK
ncbi:MAG: hypothetical protein LC109_02525 [Bacteroidia bacterium]|nr:hypothetical protein [Bacteroidia bacterium]